MKNIEKHKKHKNHMNHIKAPKPDKTQFGYVFRLPSTSRKRIPDHTFSMLMRRELTDSVCLVRVALVTFYCALFCHVCSCKAGVGGLDLAGQMHTRLKCLQINDEAVLQQGRLISKLIAATRDT